MLFAIEGIDRTDAAAARAEYLDAHVARLVALGERFVIGGPFLGDDGAASGSLMVIECAGLAEAEAFAQADPFVLHGVFGSVAVRRWEFGHLRAKGKG